MPCGLVLKYFEPFDIFWIILKWNIICCFLGGHFHFLEVKKKIQFRDGPWVQYSPPNNLQPSPTLNYDIVKIPITLSVLSKPNHHHMPMKYHPIQILISNIWQSIFYFVQKNHLTLKFTEAFETLISASFATKVAVHGMLIKQIYFWVNTT